MSTPDPPPREPTALVAAVEGVLAGIRAGVERDGGDLELLGIEPGAEGASARVRLRAKGRCFRCPMSLMTLRCAVESALRERLHSDTEVVFER